MKILRRASDPPPPPESAPEPVARRRVEITVEREGVAGVLPPSFEAHCAGCGRRVVMLSAPSAALVAQVSLRAIYRWVEAKKVHFFESAGGEPYLCALSLEALTAAEAHAGSSSEPPKTLPSGESR
jgi:hypothetical protein